MEVSQDTLLLVNDSLSVLHALHDTGNADTLLIKEVESGSLFNQITTIVTVIAAAVTAWIAIHSLRLSIFNKKIERKYYYYNKLVVEPCINIAENYSKDFRILLEKIENKDEQQARENLIKNKFIPTWDQMHSRYHQDFVSRTNNWKDDPEVSQRISKICIALEEDLAAEYKKISDKENQNTFDTEQLRSILYSAMSEITMTIQEFDPMFKV